MYASGRSTTPSLNKFYSACFIEDRGSNPRGGKKTSTELEYFKSNSAGARTYNLRGYIQTLYHCATLSLQQMAIKLKYFKLTTYSWRHQTGPVFF
jgi:hypothetical protein